jgi:hypothetical protein
LLAVASLPINLLTLFGREGDVLTQFMREFRTSHIFAGILDLDVNAAVNQNLGDGHMTAVYCGKKWIVLWLAHIQLRTAG